MKNKKILIIIFMLVLSMLITSCGTSSTNSKGDSLKASDNGDEEKVLVIAYDRDAETLDHIRTSWLSDSLVYMFDRLVSRDYDYNYVAGLAESWDTSEDGLTWTFHIREGVKFHDGKALTAEDVKWTIDTILDPEVASPSRDEFTSIQQVDVIDEHTVDIILKNPFPNLLFVLSNTSSGIANKDAYEKYGDEYGSKYVIGSGPYMFEEWIKGDKIVLAKNPDYDWGPEWMENKGKPIIDKIVLRVIPEENSRQMELEAGNVHVLRDITAVALDKLEKSEEVEVFTGEAAKLGYLAYATDKEPFTDIRVRQALNMALNKDEIIQYVFRSRASPAYGYLPPMLTDEYYAKSEEEGYKYDVKKAKQLLKDAGYEDGLTLTLSADNSTEYSRLAEVIQSQLKEVGIDAQIQLYDTASYVGFLKEGGQELFIRLYSWPNADILDSFLLSSQFPYPNHSRWTDDKTDELIDFAATRPNWEERADAYHEVQKYLIEEAVWAPIYIPERSLGVSKKVKNFKDHPWVAQYNDGIDIEDN